ncbi:hypothetical protein HDU76_000882 [Blyttiomyces sp. JEL0837]|nr:hypothetical protein HDU76_000882 [Blyttiomyces sp. JEL0837]
MAHSNSPGAVASLTSKHKVFVHKDPVNTASMYGIPLTKTATQSSFRSTASIDKVKSFFSKIFGASSSK